MHERNYFILPKLLFLVCRTAFSKRLRNIPIPEVQSTIGSYDEKSLARMEGQRSYNRCNLSGRHAPHLTSSLENTNHYREIR